MLDWSPSQTKQQNREKILEEAARLVIKPQSVHQLRLVVEQTAAKHAYNPIEALIELASEASELDDKDKVAIHKALLPFLVPQLATPKASAGEDDDSKKVRVTVTQFVFPERPQKDVTPLHEERPKPVVEPSP